MTKVLSKSDIRFKVLATVVATVAAVMLPHFVHLIGDLAGLGSALGEALLPMHLPVMLLGLFMGRYCGAVAGFAAPMMSFALSGMPKVELLPFMAIELCLYGFMMGALKDKKMPTFSKVLLSQLAGRAVRALAIVLAVYAFDYAAIEAAIIWKSIAVGLLGLILQWSFIPLISHYVDTKAKK